MLFKISLNFDFYLFLFLRSKCSLLYYTKKLEDSLFVLRVLAKFHIGLSEIFSTKPRFIRPFVLDVLIYLDVFGLAGVRILIFISSFIFFGFSDSCTDFSCYITIGSWVSCIGSADGCSFVRTTSGCRDMNLFTIRFAMFFSGFSILSRERDLIVSTGWRTPDSSFSSFL